MSLRPRLTGRAGTPLWRAAPGRLLRDPAGLSLMVVILAVVGLTAAAGPLHDEAVGDGALRTVLAAVPDRAPANQRAVVRLNAAVGPGVPVWDAAVADLDAIPGLGPPRVTAQSISPELHPRLLYGPVGPQLRTARGRAAVRLFAVADPASAVVPTGGAAPTGDGLWLPAPVAAELGVAAGDEVRVRVAGIDDAPKAVAVPVAGTYEVAGDGRTPVSPAGSRLWRELADEGFPTDSDLETLRAHLAVADLDTVGALATAIGDDLLWSAQLAPVADRPRLAPMRTTAQEVRDVRQVLAGRRDLDDLPASVRPGLASGIEQVVGDADELAAATRRGTAVTTRAGLALALVLVLAATGLALARRRREVALAAGTGRHPASTGLLHAVELLPAAVVGGLAGWWLARRLVGLAVPGIVPSAAAIRESAVWAVGAVAAGLVVAAGGAAVVAWSGARRLSGHPPARAPWRVVLVVAAAAATTGLLTRPAATSDPLGPLDLLVPSLVVAAVVAVGTRVAYALLRTRAGRGRRPGRTGLAPWLARRRLGAPDAARELTTTVAATGLGLLVFSVAALASLDDTLADRAAVAVGADTVHRVPASWVLDPDAPVQAEPGELGRPPDPDDVPDARVPPLPDGLSTVWRTRPVVGTTGLRLEVMAIDPDSLVDAADWGAPGGPVDDSRALLPDLASDGGPVPALLVGDVGSLDVEVGSVLTLDTRFFPVIVQVVAAPDAFPGVGAGPATLVVDAGAFLGEGGNDDPRLRPSPQAQFVDTREFRTDLWAAPGTDPLAVLSAAEVEPDLVGSVDQARAAPAWVAATESRRYQVGLGALLGLLGVAAVALGAVRAARRAPAADRVLALVGARAGAPARARVLEVVVVVAVCLAVAVVAVLAVRPLGPVLLEPGDGGLPDAALELPAVAWWTAAGWLATSLAVAVGSSLLVASDRSGAEVLRGED
ncbi:hypothetical protein KDN32_02025 [Nocardioides sp. J2M5]|uniref:hypothetical protein n=1 Tax=Nocardioides palaemonis TaxID=2829810 RepID=UPI001BA96B86|nr:hypothetical protein [Nocardioides palaemonis]MBS2936515.1 hypothetical protein [Nocardioides palaemonis]